jgi:hypothetical protein
MHHVRAVVVSIVIMIYADVLGFGSAEGSHRARVAIPHAPAAVQVEAVWPTNTGLERRHNEVGAIRLVRPSPEKEAVSPAELARPVAAVVARADDQQARHVVTSVKVDTDAGALYES